MRIFANLRWTLVARESYYAGPMTLSKVAASLCRRLLCICFMGVSTLLFCQQAGIERFTRCSLGDDFQIVQVDQLPQRPTVRTVTTATGDEDVRILDGYRVLVTYKADEPFANVKVEQLDLSTFKRDKGTLVANLEKLSAGPEMASKKPSETTLNGLTVYGIDRKELQGGVLSVYEIFEEKTGLVVTLYLLNDEPSRRKFHTMAEYQKIRDQFLTTYTRCLAPERSGK
jgi:hypothetical protein